MEEFKAEASEAQHNTKSLTWVRKSASEILGFGRRSCRVDLMATFGEPSGGLYGVSERFNLRVCDNLQLKKKQP